jgi:hypothetical protein
MRFVATIDEIAKDIAAIRRFCYFSADSEITGQRCFAALSAMLAVKAK